jgi:hypothetical protein
MVGAPVRTETTMDSDKHADDGPERLGKALSYVFLAGLAALFLYGYLRHFL